ncbi:glycosyltransferase [Sphingomonas sp. TX0543]|uniref:glycosyltransferase n=1 Tax=unclassified Sphingomonas TaxID=196159 RepID=UPI0010FA1D86|nr:glycosyltransferase [Sphingomonas sp. 3P27F8]
MTTRHLVVSAVNFSEGGPLTVLIDALDSAADTLGPEWTITALVHDEALVANPRIRTIAFPQSKRSWLSRLRLEWREFGKLSRQMMPDLWLSLHDMTPNVEARRQAVYCHNPSPFYKASLKEARFDIKFFLFNILYLRLYKVLINRNYAVIVQQSWLRDAFRREVGHPRVVVARPAKQAVTSEDEPAVPQRLRMATRDAPLRLLYPALPRVFKNIEILCEAVHRLPAELIPLVDLRLTMDGTENRWAAHLARQYGDVAGISLIGRQDRVRMTAEYEQCDVVLFPSRLETWGLPITEAKGFGKPLLVADLPYAHETVGNYDAVSFVAVDDPCAWRDAIARIAAGAWEPQGNVTPEPEQPFMKDWPSLWRYLTDGL